jgi:hypothetical protein
MVDHAQLTAREIHGPCTQLLTNLGGENGQEWLTALNRFLRKENPWEKPKLLRFLGTTTVPARVTLFITRDHFKVAMGKKDRLKISFVGENFTNWFLAGAGKVEAPAVAHELAYHELTKRSLDQPIVDELGGETPAESTLADIWAKMAAQGNGEEGDLLTKNYAASIFYVRDAAVGLRVVNVNWNGDGWNVAANPVSCPGEWRVGSRVFASNSIPSSV